MRAKRLRRTGLVSLTLVMALACLARAQSTEPQADKQIPALPYKSLEDTQATAGWKRFQFGEPLLFSIILPQQPKESATYTTGNDGGVTSWHYIATSPAATYGITYAVYDDDPALEKTEAQKRTSYNNFAAGFVNGLLHGAQAAEGEYGRVLAERRIRAGGIEGFERDFAFLEYQGRLQMFFVGVRSVGLFAIWKTPVESSRERADFFKSLTLEMARGPASETVGKTPLADWKRYELEDNAFSIFLPSAPESEKRTIKIGAQPIVVTYYRAQSDAAFCLLMYTPNVPANIEALSQAAREAYYQRLLDAAIASLRDALRKGGVPVEPKASPAHDALVGGIKGREQEYKLGPVDLRAQIVFAHRRAFIVIAMWQLEAPLSMREAFYESFKINLPRAPGPPNVRGKKASK
jgi:hypothetical protein